MDTDWENILDAVDSGAVRRESAADARRDRGRDSGEALTVVRGVHSLAMDALEKLGPLGTALEWPPKGDHPNYAERRAHRFEDPDAEAMRDALERVVALLDPWRKTGRTVQSTCL